ncbi:hypothetical protein RRF57_005332 [Xylaria bambusicola]|uniref:Uncharacterized protein n=1 Tax=Xylaria bambusicola TaxID=326684 RepID=A0AAN7Z5W7_9PEZI
MGGRVTDPVGEPDLGERKTEQYSITTLLAYMVYEKGSNDPLGHSSYSYMCTHTARWHPPQEAPIPVLYNVNGGLGLQQGTSDVAAGLVVPNDVRQVSKTTEIVALEWSTERVLGSLGEGREASGWVLQASKCDYRRPGTPIPIPKRLGHCVHLYTLPPDEVVGRGALLGVLLRQGS